MEERNIDEKGILPYLFHDFMNDVLTSLNPNLHETLLINYRRLRIVQRQVVIKLINCALGCCMLLENFQNPWFIFFHHRLAQEVKKSNTMLSLLAQAIPRILKLSNQRFVDSKLHCHVLGMSMLTSITIAGFSSSECLLEGVWPSHVCMDGIPCPADYEG